MSEFYYASIKTIERQTEETEELLRSLFVPKESRIIKREMNCKDIMYHKYNDYDECNDHNKCDKQQSIIMN